VPINSTKRCHKITSQLFSSKNKLINLKYYADYKSVVKKKKSQTSF